MIARYNRKSLLFGVPGIVLQTAGNILARVSEDREVVNIGTILMLAGTGLLLVGLASYAKAKGRHPAWCLLAFLSVIGMFILASLRDCASGDQTTGPFSAEVRMEKSQPSPIVRFGLGLFAILLVVSAPMSGYFLVQIFLDAKASANWPSVTGMLTKSQVGDRGAGRYFADVAYTYRIGASEFVGSKVRASDGDYNIRDGAVQMIRGLAVGQPVTVYYDPSNPRKALLRPGAGFQEYALLFVPLMMFGIGVGAFWLLFRRRPTSGD